MLKAILALLFLLHISVANAGEFSGNVTIQQTYTGVGWTMVTVSGTKKNPDNCAGDGYYAINTSTSNYEAIHASILAAQLAGRTVQFWLGGCAGQNNSYPQISSIQVN